MKFEDVKPGAIFIEKAKLNPIGGKEPPHLYLHIARSGPSINTSFQCSTLDVYENKWSPSYWKSRQWESAGGGKLTEREYRLLAKTIFTATHD